MSGRAMLGIGALALEAVLAAMLSLLGGCSKAQHASAESAVHEPPLPSLVIALDAEQRALLRTLSPLPEAPADPTNAFARDAGARELGRLLFHDVRLSGNGEVSCASCHAEATGFSVPTALGAGMGTTLRHPPTLWNVAHQRWFFWDGRIDTLWGQALVPIEAPHEMGGSRLAALRLVASDPELSALYRRVFGPLPDLEGLPAGAAMPAWHGVASEASSRWRAIPEARREELDRAFARIGKALAAFQSGLVSRPAPFDVFVEGLEVGDDAKVAALSPTAQRGLELFIGRADCILCHHGPTFSDQEFHNIGLDAGEGSPDVGRYDGVQLLKATSFGGTGPFSDAPDHPVNQKTRYLALKPSNMGEFKTPGLRELAHTAPYMHDGRFPSLERVVRYYSDLDQAPAFGHREESLAPLDLRDDEVADLVAFLEALSSEPQASQR